MEDNGISIRSVAMSRRRDDPAHLERIEATLKARADDIAHFKRVTGFTGKNISSMLATSGASELAMEALLGNTDKFSMILASGTLSASNISNILSSQGKYITVGVDAIIKRLPQIKLICGVVNPSQFANKLHNIPAHQLGGSIDSMFRQFIKERKAMEENAVAADIDEPGLIMRDGRTRILNAIYKSSEETPRIR